MASFQRAAREAKHDKAPLQHLRQVPISASTTSVASNAQARGFERLRSLGVAVRRSSSINSAATTPLPSPYSELPMLRELTAEEVREQKIRDWVKDENEAKRELKHYEEVGVLTGPCERVTDLVRYWEV
jgi:hypothetical protein